MGAGWLVEGADFVGEDAGGVDDAFGGDGGLGAGFGVPDGGSGDFAGGVLELRRPGVVEDGGTVVECGAGEGEGKAGVVELGVVVEDAALEAVGGEAGDAGSGGFAGEQAGGAHGGFAGEEIVEGEAGTVPRQLPEVGGGEEGGERVDEVGGVAEHDGALVESLADEVDLAGGEVADAAVDELGGAGAGGLGEVARLDKGGAEAAGGGVYGDAETGGPAAEDEDVELGVESGEGLGSGCVGALGSHWDLVSDRDASGPMLGMRW